MCLHHLASQCSTQVIVRAISDSTPFELDSHESVLFEARRKYKQLMHLKHADYLTTFAHNLIPFISVPCLGQNNDLSVWLSVLPTERDNFDLTPQEFRDAFAIRYCKPLLNVPAFCDGCGVPSTLDHF